MRMRWIWAVLAMSTPAVAQDAPGTPDVTVTDLSVTSRGGSRCGWPKGGGEVHVTFPFRFLASTP